ncbi:MAG TPA: rod shape-determining protein MreC [Balneolaceae bacterium]|nr:rod shape-determining protein MreC [Balneolaceae bacterium]
MNSQLIRISRAKDYILTALFLIIATTLLVGRNRGGITNLRKISVTAYSYLEEPIAQFHLYQQAIKTNRKLRRQNVILRDSLNRLQWEQHQNKNLRSLLRLRDSLNLHLYPVRIIGKELHQANNMLTIDAGSENGLKRGMPLISARGLVGKIVLTSPKYAEVIPYFNTLFKISAKLQNSNAYGIVSWDGESNSKLELRYVPQTVRVAKGETVLTSGYNRHIPPNIPIGKVTGYKPNKGKGTQRIFVKPAANIYSISAGFIITSKPDSSREILSKKYQQLFNE